MNSQAGIATKNKAPRGIVQIQTPAAAVPIIDVIDEPGACRVAQYAYDQPTLGQVKSLLALIVLARQRTARATELGKRQHPRFGGGLRRLLRAGGGIVLAAD